MIQPSGVVQSGVVYERTTTFIRVGFNIVWSVLYERSKYNTLQTMLKRTYIDDPLLGRQLLGRSLKPSVGRRCHRAEVIVHACGL